MREEIGRGGEGNPARETKQELRSRYVRASLAQSPEEREAASGRIAGRIARLPAYQAASTVLVYSPLAYEVDLKPLLEDPASAGKRFAYPCCLSGTEMAAYIPGPWKTGIHGIHEPVPEASEEVPPEDIDFVVCPGIAFDGARTRLGTGRAYYDRYLPRCRNACVVQAAFEAQHAEVLPAEPHDRRMDRVITEKAVY